MSDRITEFKHIVDDAAETISLWNSMKADIERCRQKIERLRGELSWVQDPAAAADLLNAIRFMDYTAHQYQAQVDRFPGKLAEIRQRSTFLALSQEEAHHVTRRGGLN